MPEMVEVRSSLLNKVGYVPEKRNLIVEFRNKRVYVYHDVPPAVFRDLLAAESQGAFFVNHIKGRFAYGERPLGDGGGET
jgi:lysyl-tRNA synthetase class 2